MKTLRTAALATLAVAAILCARPSGATTVYSDQIFKDPDWTIMQEAGNGPATAAQQLTGGNPNEYRRVDHNNFSDTLLAYHLSSGAIHNLAIEPIQSLKFSIDQIAILNHANIGVGIGVALRQGTKNYMTVAGAHVNSTFSWVTFVDNGLTASSFRTWTNPNDHPDFSSAGGLIQFGFFTQNSNDGALRSRAAGFDNWEVTVNPVPEPSTLAILAVGAVSMLGRRRT